MWSIGGLKGSQGSASRSERELVMRESIAMMKVRSDVFPYKEEKDMA